MKQHIPILVLFILLLAQTACEKDRLSPTNPVYIDEAAAFSTAERTLSAVQGLYAGVKGPFYNG